MPIPGVADGAVVGVVEGGPRAPWRVLPRPNLPVDDDPSAWLQAESPVYGERGVMIRYRVADLIWRPLRRQVRFVAVDHPTRGKILLLSTDLALDPIDVIRLYGIRFKIELSFKQALRVVGVYAYHFWMMTMKPRSREMARHAARREKQGEKPPELSLWDGYVIGELRREEIYDDRV